MGMRWVFCNELAFLKIEEGRSFAVGILYLKSEEAGEMKGEKKREVGQHASFRGVEMQKCVFDEVEQVGIGFGLFYAFLQ